MSFDAMLEKTLPNSLEAERAILGAILLDDASIHVTLSFLEANDFYLEAHRRIYEKMNLLINTNKAIDIITLKNELQLADELESAGGAAYLVSLTDGLPRAINLEHYAGIVKEYSALRAGIQISHETMVRCYAAEPFKDTINGAFDRLDTVLSGMERREGPRPVSELVSETYRNIEAIANRQSPDGFKTGFCDLDRMIPAGIQKKSLNIIAARPGGGKTSLLLGMARRMAVRNPVVIFSLEMSANELIVRLLADMGRIDITRMNTGFMSRDDWNKISRAAGDLCSLPIWIDDSSGLTVADMRSRTRRIKATSSGDYPHIILIDYLQLVAAPKHMVKASPIDRVSYVSMGLKAMSKNMDSAVIAAAQLSRSPEKRRDPRPKLSDLRESGQIEQDADVVAMLYREELTRQSEENKGITDVILAKQRNGPTGEFSMLFIKENSAFTDFYAEGE